MDIVYKNGRIYAAKSDGTIEIACGDSNLYPGEEGINLNSSAIYYRISDGAWHRITELGYNMHKARELSKEAVNCKEFLEKVSHD